MKSAYLIDAPIYVLRSHFAFFRPGAALPFQSRDGESQATHAVYGFTLFMLEMLLKQPTYIAAAFDGPLDKCWRKSIYNGYKENRGVPCDNVRYQMKACKAVTTLLGVRKCETQIYEADDIIASLCTSMTDDVQINIVSTDKDLVQLVTAPTRNMYHIHNGKEIILTKQQLQERWCVDTTQMVEFLSLVGDRADNIMGVPNVGPKKAQAILSRFPTVESALEHPELLEGVPVRGAKTLHTTLQDNKDTFDRNMQLIRLLSNIKPIANSKPADSRPQPPDYHELCDYLKSLGIATSAVINKLDKYCHA
eukprot:TRINITY_DN16458_c0_g1_i1.p1 TRINITY_DN16458_c0_g1~~TRINITY_DN16458_c0_g1_i1.p1  ORF type:complete len:323 (+),score=105.58 TRINITY_DN16458_c0_g1_i1:50-970(+)